MQFEDAVDCPACLIGERHEHHTRRSPNVAARRVSARGMGIRRHLWGVAFVGAGKGRPLLLGVGWAATVPPRYDGEPSRALLFTSRAAARRWCAAKQATYAGRTDACAQWRFTPVRVREVVRPCKVRR